MDLNLAIICMGMLVEVKGMNKIPLKNFGVKVNKTGHSIEIKLTNQQTPASCPPRPQALSTRFPYFKSHSSAGFCALYYLYIMECRYSFVFGFFCTNA